MTPRFSTALRAVTTAGHLLAQGIIGLLLMGAGGFVAYSALQQEPHDKAVLYSGLGVLVFGAIVFPSIYPVAQKIVVLIFPNGIPLIGGKRASDPPAPPPAS